MNIFPQPSVYQPNIPVTPTSPTIPTTPTIPIFSIQRPVASHLDAKRKPTGIQTRSDRQPNALQRASRCGKNRLSPSVEKRYIASHIAVYIVFVFYLNEKQSVKSVTLFVQNSIGRGLSHFTGMTLWRCESQQAQSHANRRQIIMRKTVSPPYPSHQTINIR